MLHGHPSGCQALPGVHVGALGWLYRPQPEVNVFQIPVGKEMIGIPPDERFKRRQRPVWVVHHELIAAQNEISLPLAHVAG